MRETLYQPDTAILGNALEEIGLCWKPLGKVGIFAWGLRYYDQKQHSKRPVSMARDITLYEEYDGGLRHRIWEKIREDYYGDFKTRFPSSGRAQYREVMSERIAQFEGQFYLDCNSQHDPLLDEVRGKTLYNFIGKQEDREPPIKPSIKTLRYCHAYLLVKYPKSGKSLRTDKFIEEYFKFVEAKYLNWKHTDPETLKRIKPYTNALCGIYVNEPLDHYPASSKHLKAPEYEEALETFGGAYRMIIITEAVGDTILLAHYMAFERKDISQLLKGDIASLKKGRASGAVIPSVIKLESKTRVIRFDLHMSNRQQNDIPFDLPIIVHEDDVNRSGSKVTIDSFTSNGFEYAPKLKFVRNKRFDKAGKKLLDLYDIDM